MGPPRAMRQSGVGLAWAFLPALYMHPGTVLPLTESSPTQTLLPPAQGVCEQPGSRSPRHASHNPLYLGPYQSYPQSTPSRAGDGNCVQSRSG